MGKVVIERCNYSSRRSWGPEGMVSGDSVCVSCGVGAVARRWHQSKSSLKCLNYSVEWSSMAFRSSSKLTLSGILGDTSLFLNHLKSLCSLVRYKWVIWLS